MSKHFVSYIFYIILCILQDLTHKLIQYMYLIGLFGLTLIRGSVKLSQEIYKLDNNGLGGS